MFFEKPYHRPVLLEETLSLLVNKSDGIYVDATFGGGGHSLALLESFSRASVVAFDWDEDAFFNFKANRDKFGDRLIFIRDNFAGIKNSLASKNIHKVDGILADLGVSSRQLDDLSGGFSFNSPTLDMRMDERNPLTAESVLNDLSADDLADVFYKYAEEYFSRPIARAIVERRKRGRLTSPAELVAIVSKVKPSRGKVNPATKVFQALRIFVNKELDNLNALLADAPSLLNVGGRLAIISFHSLEDRPVKFDFKDKSKAGVYAIKTKKSIVASRQEVLKNPRARSAKLRVVEKI